MDTGGGRADQCVGHEDDDGRCRTTVTSPSLWGRSTPYATKGYGGRRIRRSPGIAWADVHATETAVNPVGVQLLSVATTGERRRWIRIVPYQVALLRNVPFLRPERATRVTSISITCNRRTPRVRARHGDYRLRLSVAGDRRP